MTFPFSNTQTIIVRYTALFQLTPTNVEVGFRLKLVLLSYECFETAI